MNNQYKRELTFIDLSRLFLRKKWIFIITFIIIFIATFAYFYLKPDEYTVDTKIRITEEFMGNNNELYSYYPEDMEKLWIFPTYKSVDSERKKLEIIAGELISDEIITKTEKYLDDNYGINIDGLRDTFTITVDNTNRDITISATYNKPETSIKIADSLLNVYIMAKQDHFEGLYTSFLNKLVNRVDDDFNELERLNSEKNKYEAEYYMINTKPAEERNVDLISEVLSKAESFSSQINTLNKNYQLLKKVKENLENNKEFFINKIDITRELETSNIVSNRIGIKRNIAYSGLLGLLIAFIITFIASISYYSKYIKRN